MGFSFSVLQSPEKASAPAQSALHNRLALPTLGSSLAVDFQCLQAGEAGPTAGGSSPVPGELSGVPAVG